jgi:hypothetical protein
MANPSTSSAASAVDEAVRIAAEGSRRTTESAQAFLQAGRKYYDQAAQLNRDLLTFWTAAADAGFQTAFEIQNAALKNAQDWFETSASLNKEALRRWADLTRQAQATTLKTYQNSAKLFESVTAAD